MVNPSDAPRWRGLWHLALRVSDIARSRAFYQDVLGMKVVWEPDADNIYLSSGQDNLALHQATPDVCISHADSPLDHFGFFVHRKEDVDLLAKKMEEIGVILAKPVRLHRDGSYSFYIDDPDHNRIQILYSPQIS